MNTTPEISEEGATAFRPSGAGTFTLLIGLMITYLAIGGETPSAMARNCAWMVGVTLLVSFVVEANIVGFRQMIRVDVAALVALFMLTLAEFLVPQPVFDLQVQPDDVETGLGLVIMGMASLCLGRHLVPMRSLGARLPTLPELSLAELFVMSILCFGIGHLHMFLAVGFDPLALFRELTDPRFTQDWMRGQLGGWYSLLYELNLLTYLIPPAGAMLILRWRRLPIWWLPGILGMVAFEFFSGFSQGSRNVFAIHLITFCAALGLSMRRITLRRALLMLIPVMALLIFASTTALEFRRIGLRTYLREVFSGAPVERLEGEMSAGSNLEFMVDNNLRAISAISAYFPGRHEFLGEEVILHGLIHPIPRALWPGKPVNLAVSSEQILGIKGATIASTFVGEAFMAYGPWGVIGFGVTYGILCAFWNRIGAIPNHRTLLLLYAAGMFWVTLGIRSSVWISVAALPCLALYIYARYCIPILRGPSDEAVSEQSSHESV